MDKEKDIAQENKIDSYVISVIFSFFIHAKIEQDRDRLLTSLRAFQNEFGNADKAVIACHPEKNYNILHLVAKGKIDFKFLPIIEAYIDQNNLGIYNHKNIGGDTPLALAMINKNHEALKALIESQKRVLERQDLPKEKIYDVLKDTINIKNYKGFTPLHYAACSHDKEHIEQLLLLGADVTVINVDGNTPAHLAAKNEYNYVQTEEILCLLARAGANPHAKNKENMTVLLEAYESSRSFAQQLYKSTYTDIFLWKEINSKAVQNAYIDFLNSKKNDQDILSKPSGTHTAQIMAQRKKVQNKDLQALSQSDGAHTAQIMAEREKGENEIFRGSW